MSVIWNRLSSPITALATPGRPYEALAAGCNLEVSGAGKGCASVGLLGGVCPEAASTPSRASWTLSEYASTAGGSGARFLPIPSASSRKFGFGVRPLASARFLFRHIAILLS